MTDHVTALFMLIDGEEYARIMHRGDREGCEYVRDNLHAVAQPLDVQMQGDTCCLWALCDERAEKEPRRFVMYGTGHPVPSDPGKYIATFQMHDGALVFHVHVFEHQG